MASGEQHIHGQLPKVNFSYVLFADDTNSYCSGKSLEWLLNTVEREMKVQKTQFDMNQFSQNFNKKKKFMLFGNQSNKQVKITINNVQCPKIMKLKLPNPLLYYIEINIPQTKSHFIFCTVVLILPYTTYLIW